MAVHGQPCHVDAERDEIDALIARANAGAAEEGDPPGAAHDEVADDPRPALAPEALIDAGVDASAEAAQGDVVSAVNYNAPGQVVIAGSAAAVARAVEACKARGAKRALPLPVSVPSHCELMRPAAERFAEAVNAIAWQAPQIPLVQNVSAAVVADLDTLKRDLLAQLYSPVRWVESIVRLGEQGVTDLVECGPGKVLSGLNKRCVKGVNTHNLDTPESFAAARAALADGDLSRAVNAPSLGGLDVQRVRPILDLAQRLGTLGAAVAGGPLRSLEIRYSGSHPGGLRVITAAAVAGALAHVSGGAVNVVNATRLAQSRGIRVNQMQQESPVPYTEVVEIRVSSDAGTSRVAGALLGDTHERIVQVETPAALVALQAP